MKFWNLFNMFYIHSIAQIFYLAEIRADGCRKSVDDLSYNGNISITRHGRTCQMWSTASHYQSEQLNYCRTPIGVGDNSGGPWCYNDIFWDRCNVPICSGAVCPDLKGHNLETLEKNLTYQYGEKVYLKCKAGYTLVGQEFLTCDQSGQWNETIPRCGEIDECLSNPCLNGGLCSDGINEYTCTCQDNFMGMNCQYDISKCDNTACMNGGICKDVSNETLCICQLGYTGEYCQNIPAFKIAPKTFLAAKITFDAEARMRYIPCIAEGIPLPIITWESIDFTEQPMAMPSLQFHDNGQVLIVVALNTRESGPLTCTALNEFGDDKISVAVIFRNAGNSGFG